MITAKTSRGMCSELYGLSTDMKPTDVTNASTFFEMDTSTLYIFDTDSHEWYEVLSSASGSEGAIRYDEAMELSDAEMKQARDNISAAFGKKLVYLNMLYDDIVDSNYVVSLGQFRPEEIEIKDWFFTVDFHIGKITAISNNDVTVQLTSQSLVDYFVTRSITLKVDAVESQPADSVDIWLPSTNGHSIVEMHGTQSQDVTLRGVADPTNNNDAANKAYVDAQSGSATPAAVASAIGDMTSAQAAQAVSDLGAEPEKLVVTVTKSGAVYSADKTFVEIAAAYDAGATVVVEYGGFVFMPTTVADDEIWFVNVYDLTIRSLVMYDDESVEYYSHAVAEYIPAELVNGQSVEITPTSGKEYKCTASSLTSLTITNPPANGAYSIVFTSGSTATTTTIPSSILGLENFAAEANTMYEINVLDNRAVVGGWAVSAS